MSVTVLQDDATCGCMHVLLPASCWQIAAQIADRVLRAAGPGSASQSLLPILGVLVLQRGSVT
eukprot:12133823-Alexandrium_andersonii.AAC.1